MRWQRPQLLVLGRAVTALVAVACFVLVCVSLTMPAIRHTHVTSQHTGHTHSHTGEHAHHHSHAHHHEDADQEETSTTHVHLFFLGFELTLSDFLEPARKSFSHAVSWRKSLHTVKRELHGDTKQESVLGSGDSGGRADVDQTPQLPSKQITGESIGPVNTIGLLVQSMTTFCCPLLQRQRFDCCNHVLWRRCETTLSSGRLRDDPLLPPPRRWV